jgi:hypothetical protein
MLRRVSGALGLRAHERTVELGQGRVQVRLAIPLPRRFAQAARDRIDRTPSAAKRALLPRRSSSIDSFEATSIEGPELRVSYVPGGSFGSLRRLLVVDAGGADEESARRRANEGLVELGLGELTQEPTAAKMRLHARAAHLFRARPALLGALYFDADEWPPYPDVLEAEERAAGIPRADIDRIRVAPERTLAFSVAKERALGFDVTPPTLVYPTGSIDEVASALVHGFLAPRWLLLGYGSRPESIQGVEDLKGQAGAFVAFKLLDPKKEGAFIEEPEPFLVTIDGGVFDLLERHVLERDRYGVLGPIERGLADPDLVAAIRADAYGDGHEVLFPDAMPAGVVSGVLVRDARLAPELDRRLAELRLRTRLTVTERYPRLR